MVLANSFPQGRTHQSECLCKGGLDDHPHRVYTALYLQRDAGTGRVVLDVRLTILFSVAVVLEAPASAFFTSVVAWEAGPN